MIQRAIHYTKCAGRKAYSAAPFIGFFVGGFIGGGLTVANPPPWLNVGTPAPKVAVKPVQSVMVDPYSKRTAELCASSADLVQKMRDEWKDMKAKMAPSKTAPGK